MMCRQWIYVFQSREFRIEQWIYFGLNGWHSGRLGRRGRRFERAQIKNGTGVVSSRTSIRVFGDNGRRQVGVHCFTGNHPRFTVTLRPPQAVSYSLYRS
jgi:hypothetical protein